METAETPDFTKLPLDDLLLRTQTNITFDPQMGYAFALAAYERARDPGEAEKNPAAAGIAARQAGFRAAQTAQTKEDRKIVWKHFDDSIIALSGDNPPCPRELTGTYVLGLRAAILLNSGNPRRWARTADRRLKAQHAKGEAWDRLGTMNDKFWATHEAMNGNPLKAARLAIRGIYRARRAAQESDTEQAHDVFVKKQTKLNLAAGLLAVSRVISFGPIRKLRAKIADKIIRGPTN